MEMTREQKIAALLAGRPQANWSSRVVTIKGREYPLDFVSQSEDKYMRLYVEIESIVKRVFEGSLDRDEVIIISYQGVEKRVYWSTVSTTLYMQRSAAATAFIGEGAK